MLLLLLRKLNSLGAAHRSPLIGHLLRQLSTYNGSSLVRRPCCSACWNKRRVELNKLQLAWCCEEKFGQEKKSQPKEI